MRGMPNLTRNSTRGGFASAFAMALALGGATVAATALTSAPALAESKPSYSKNFVKAYQPLAAIVNAATGDFASVKPQVPALLAAVGNDDDRNAAGNLILILGNKLSDPALQRQGLEMMLASGKVAPDKVGQFQFFVGNLAYSAKDFPGARKALQASIAAGYTQNDPEAMLAESYFGEGLAKEGLAYFEGVIKARRAAGTTVPDNWVTRGLKIAYESKLNAEAVTWSKMLVAGNPTPKNWLQSLQVVGAVSDLDPQAQLDLLRLMLETGGISTRNEYVLYIETADPRIMAAEVNKVLAAGVAAGKITATEDYYKEVKRVVDARLPSQATEAAQYAKEARGPAGKGSTAQSAGDIYLSIGDLAQAEAMYQLALDKGVTDRNVALTRLGMVQARQGKGDAAKATLQQVTGPRANVAQMWSAYVDSKKTA
jgi:tetratricopeptide (TPR) repeat protein